MTPEQITLAMEVIARDIKDAEMSMESAMCAWKIGLAAFKESLNQGASFPHHRGTLDSYIHPSIEALLNKESEG